MCKSLMPTKLTIIWYNTRSYNTNIPYNLPPFFAVNNGYTFSYALIGIRYYWPLSNAYNIVFNLKGLCSFDS